MRIHRNHKNSKIFNQIRMDIATLERNKRIIHMYENLVKDAIHPTLKKSYQAKVDRYKETYAERCEKFRKDHQIAEKKSA